MKKNFIPPEEGRSEYYSFGFTRFGPFLYGFVRWLNKELLKKGYDRIFFFSRDGYMMKKAFEIINDGSVAAEYVYFSRKSLRQTMLWKCSSYEDSLKYLTWERFFTFGQILEYYGFDEAERAEISRKTRISSELTAGYDELGKNDTFKKVYSEYKDVICQRSEQQEKLLKDYLIQTGMTGKCAIADIGWHGNMQYYLGKFCVEQGTELVPEGFYVGISPNDKLDSPVNGYIYDEHDMSAEKKVLCFLGGYEKLFQGYDGSTYGYRRDGSGRVCPVFAPYEYEGDEKVKGIIKEWQEGALDFVRMACDKGLDTPDSELTAPLIRFGTSPSLKDTRLFSFLYNIDGTKVYYTAQKGMFRRGIKEVLHAFGRSPWKTGFMRSVMKIPFPYYLIYKVMKK